MDRKPVRNAFYFYMQEFREEQRKIGKTFKSMVEVAKAVGPLWKEADQKTKQFFNAKAKRERERLNQPSMKFNSQGVSYAMTLQREQEKRDAYQAECQDIENLVKLKAFSGELKQQEFFMMDVNSYCQSHDHYVIGEMTLLCFNLAEGLINEYHRMVHPGQIPIGYGSDARAASKELGLELPDEAAPHSNFRELLIDVLNYTRGKDARAPPPFFTMPDKVAACASFLQQLSARSAHDEAIFRVYRADLLMFYLVNAYRSAKHEGFSRQSLALTALEKDFFNYSPGLACDFHEVGVRTNNCTMSRTKRWAFTIFDFACPLAGLPLLPGCHLPGDYDMEKIERIYEYKKMAQRVAPTVANVLYTSESTIDSSFNNSARTVWGPPSIAGVGAAAAAAGLYRTNNVDPQRGRPNVWGPPSIAGVGAAAAAVDLYRTTNVDSQRGRPNVWGPPSIAGVGAAAATVDLYRTTNVDSQRGRPNGSRNGSSEDSDIVFPQLSARAGVGRGCGCGCCCFRGQAPFATAGVGRGQAPFATAGVGRGQAPRFTAGVGLGQAPRFTAGVGLWQAPRFTAGVGLGQAPRFTAGVGLGQAPRFTAGVGLGQAPRFTAGVGHGQAPRATAGVGHGQAPRATAGVGYGQPPRARGIGRGEAILASLRAMRLQ